MKKKIIAITKRQIYLSKNGRIKDYLSKDWLDFSKKCNFELLPISNKTKIKLKDVNFSYENYEYRNDNIYDFLEGADELTKKGYFVLRVGKINEIKLESKNKMIIDYYIKWRTD